MAGGGVALIGMTLVPLLSGAIAYNILTDRKDIIDEDKTRHISIEIHFNLKPIPEVEQVTA